MGDIRSRIAADRTRVSVVIQSGSRLFWPPKALSTIAADEPNISKICFGANPCCLTVQVPACRVETDLIAQRQAKLLRKRHTRPEETKGRNVGHRCGC